ncbi:hypothetical protein [Pseudoroseomonas cervicalis]|uniref:hypothetical protein n=1 Tax=Teichococcus cervicalis TaxID=204525 RepID=UPI002783DF03|nr:hypothetical protein [Pseudoroseomonas cervicalis]MDQ1079335.1 hypothetical protein [Pseudoroseomonas cervicalis]
MTTTKGAPQLFARKPRLPMNRKERFYTGTVLPGIIWSDRLQRFLAMLGPGYQGIEVSPDGSNVLFFTEYDLRDAIRGNRSAGWQHLCEEEKSDYSGDTPDLVILIEGPRPLLLVIEAKLFSNATKDGITGQIERQKNCVVEPLKRILGDCEILQIALLTDKARAILFPCGTRTDFEILTWDCIVGGYREVSEAGYWVEVLDYALRSYDELLAIRSPNSGHGVDYLLAQTILDYVDDSVMPIRYVGAQPKTWWALREEVRLGLPPKIKLAVTDAEERPSDRYLSLRAFRRLMSVWERMADRALR